MLLSPIALMNSLMNDNVFKLIVCADFSDVEYFDIGNYTFIKC